tara:strand:- start:133 stop:348 length:216 start_codon:yes stop_codon:yes gene_type:complete
MVGIYEIIGSIGLILIVLAQITKKRKIQYELDIFGGVALLIYSLWLKNLIFIVLQAMFVIVAAYELYKTKF